MRKIMMYEKSTCGTCRKERVYLSNSKIGFEVIDIVKNPPTREFLERNIDESNLDAFLNKYSKPYRENKLAEIRPTKSELIDLMLKDPNLIKRPILIEGKKVFFGYTEI